MPHYHFHPPRDLGFIFSFHCDQNCLGSFHNFIYHPPPPIRLPQQPADAPSAASLSFSIKVELYRCQQWRGRGEGLLKAVSLRLGFIVSVWGRRKAPCRQETTNIHFLYLPRLRFSISLGTACKCRFLVADGGSFPVDAQTGCFCDCCVRTGEFLCVFYGAFMENASTAPSPSLLCGVLKVGQSHMAIFSRGYLYTPHSWRFIALHASLRPQRYLSINGKTDMSQGLTGRRVFVPLLIIVFS